VTVEEDNLPTVVLHLDANGRLLTNTIVKTLPWGPGPFQPSPKTKAILERLRTTNPGAYANLKEGLNLPWVSTDL